MDSREIARVVLEEARARRVEYADLRVVESRSELLRVRNGQVDAVSRGEERGLGVRVICRGAWGFASSARLSRREIGRVVSQAVAIARASSTVNTGRVQLSPAPVVEDVFRTKRAVDPFRIKTEEKLSLLGDADRLMRANESVRVSRAQMRFVQEKKVFASTEGAYIEQEFLRSGAGISATAVGNGDAQERSYPSSFDGDHAHRGYEFVEGLDLAGHAEKVAAEAAQLLGAERCPTAEQTLILGGSQVALQLHESCGHPAELDRILGAEISFAGGSFLQPDDLGKLRYGADCVTVTADASLEEGVGGFRYDDEGVPARRFNLVDKGVLAGFLSSRETAARLGTVSNGAMRAAGWNRLPLVRMTNINLEPGNWTLEEMIKDTKKGVYLDTTKSWSIDDERLNFHFATEIGWVIEDGSPVRMVKNATYTGVTPHFWRSCDAVRGCRALAALGGA